MTTGTSLSNGPPVSFALMAMYAILALNETENRKLLYWSTAVSGSGCLYVKLTCCCAASRPALCELRYVIKHPGVSFFACGSDPLTARGLECCGVCVSGKGWYNYEKGSRKPVESPEVAALLDAHRAEIGR